MLPASELKQLEAEQVKAMTYHAGWAVLVAELQAKIDYLAAEIDRGKLSYDDYLRYTSRKQGVSLILETAKRLSAMANNKE